MLSVNTNSSALSAVRNLKASSEWLKTLHTRISTGLNVSSVKDNAAIYSIAQRMRGDLAGLNATVGSIDRATVTVDVATVATESISDLLNEMKGKLVSMLDAQKNGDTSGEALYKSDLDALREMIKSRITSASFNGSNLIDQGNDIISALASSDGDETLDFEHKDLQFGGAIITLTDDSNYTMEALDASIKNVNRALGHFGTASRRLEIQKEFTNKLHDVIETSIGRLVDADLARTAADLEAAQIKIQLGIASLNIANKSPQAILSLFKPSGR
ncbi:MAG: flagellin [Kordiimonadaceae bacterium]|nr:flagellin [Kordiimonadaceae bacterium]